MTQNVGTGSLIRASFENRPRNNDEKVKEDTKGSDTEDDGCDGNIDLPEIAGEGAAEEQQGDLQHQRQRLHHMVEVPRDNPVEFALPVLATLDGGPSHVSRRVSIQPLLAEHRDEGGEKRGSETRVQDGLDLDYGFGRAGPLLSIL